MAWTNPRDWNIGELVTKAIMDTHVRDNLNYLKSAIDIATKINARQGGSATHWNTGGTTNYTPPIAKIQVGTTSVLALTLSGSFYVAQRSITFPEAFTYIPLVIGTMTTSGSSNASTTGLVVSNISETGATFNMFATATGISLSVSWIAIGE